MDLGLSPFGCLLRICDVLNYKPTWERYSQHSSFWMKIYLSKKKITQQMIIALKSQLREYLTSFLVQDVQQTIHTYPKFSN